MPGDSPVGAREHWEAVYARGADRVSWYQPEATMSMRMVATAGVPPGTPVIDVGGGASQLAAQLLDAGFTDVTVLDVSGAAIEAARQAMGPKAGLVTWLEADLLRWQPARRYGLWHDRAVFHFLVDESERARYRELLDAGLTENATVVMATFAPDGPEQCSGLPVMRYDALGIVHALDGGLELVEECREEHVTPRAVHQPFTWVRLRRSR